MSDITTLPTWPEYRRLIREKAKEVDAGKWLATVGNTTVQTFSGIIVLVAITGSLSDEKRIAIAGIGLGLLLIATWNAWRCFTYAPWKMHCDQLDKLATKQREINEIREMHYQSSAAIEDETATASLVSQVMTALAEKGSKCGPHGYANWSADVLEFLGLALHARMANDFKNHGFEHQAMQPVNTRDGKIVWLNEMSRKITENDVRHDCKKSKLSKWI